MKEEGKERGAEEGKDLGKRRECRSLGEKRLKDGKRGGSRKKGG